MWLFIFLSDPSSQGFIIVCLPEEMYVKIPKEFVRDPELLHLNDPECGVADTTDTHVVLKTPLEGCGNAHRALGRKVVYTNNVWFARQSDGNEKSQAPIQFPFRCSYKSTRLPLERDENDAPKKWYVLSNSRSLCCVVSCRVVSCRVVSCCVALRCVLLCSVVFCFSLHFKLSLVCCFAGR